MKYLLFALALAALGCEQILGIQDTYVVERWDATPIQRPPPDASAADGFTQPQPQLPKELIEVRLLDAVTDQPLSAPVDVTIDGSAREMVLDQRGQAHSEFPASEGSVRFGLAEQATFPVSLILRASGPGLLHTSLPLVIYRRSSHVIDLRMVALDNPPTGVHVARDDSGYVGTGGLSMPVTIATPAASASIPEGIVILDRSGMPLSGNIVVELAHYESGRPESLIAFPGGMDAVTNQGDGVFASGGLISLEITDESGRRAETFQNGEIAVTMSVPTGIMSPEENRPMVSGDSIGLWSHDAVTGIWTYEGDVELAGEGEELTAQFSVNHLSLWNLDFKLNKCDISRAIEIRIQGSFDLVPESIASRLLYELSYVNFDGTRPSFVRRFRPGDLTDFDPAMPDNVLRFRNAPMEDSGRIVLTAYWQHYLPECYMGMKDFNVVNDTPLCAETPSGFGVYPAKPINCFPVTF